MADLGSDHSAGQDGTPALPSPNISVEAVRSKVFIGLPWQKITNPMTSFCITAIADRRRAALSMIHGDAYVIHSRNRIADAFLKSPFEWALMVDDDMLIPMGDANWYNAHTGFNLPPHYAGMNTLNRLLSHQKTVVGGLYFGRQPHGKPMYCEGANNPEEAVFARKAPHDIVKPTRWIATGCLLVHRTVFEDIEKKFPLLSRLNNSGKGQWFTPSEATLTRAVDDTLKALSAGEMNGEMAYKARQILSDGMALARRESSLGMGEDVAFCRRAAMSGHQPHVDLGLVCGHLGFYCFGPRNTAL